MISRRAGYPRPASVSRSHDPRNPVSSTSYRCGCRCKDCYLARLTDWLAPELARIVDDEWLGREVCRLVKTRQPTSHIMSRLGVDYATVKLVRDKLRIAA